MNDDDALAEWRADRLRGRVEAFQARRPVLLRHPGRLNDEVAEWGSRLFDGTARNLVVVGDIGTAKTWNMWEVLERAVKVGYAGTILFATPAEWQDIVGPPADRDRLREMRVADVLVLDDLGSSRINEWQREILLGVIDERWQHGRPTAITSNMDEFDNALGPRLTSRLGDGAIEAILEGEDLRAAR
ncbi:ATP-binding protein [Streptosporangium sp. NPDC000239]|uniref:ATP-binding protein n=1 Tax=Streptosporangium sp. NPDC000239 TaxID=3154248 RepID=UPI00332D1C93